MISVACVYLPKDQKYKIVKTSSVLKLDPESFDSDDENHKNILRSTCVRDRNYVCVQAAARKVGNCGGFSLVYFSCI